MYFHFFFFEDEEEHMIPNEHEQFIHVSDMNFHFAHKKKQKIKSM